MIRKAGAAGMILWLMAACIGRQKNTALHQENQVLSVSQAVVNSPLLEDLFKRNPLFFNHILENPEKFRIQVIYSQIDRDKNNIPAFTHHFYQVNDQYFYPASTVKFPAAVLALEKVNDLKAYGINKHTALEMDSIVPNEPPAYYDNTSEDGQPSIAHYIKKVLLVSDNDAFNRLYAFLGQEGFNRRLRELGFTNAEIIHRLNISLSEIQNRTTNPFRFKGAGGAVLYAQKEVKSNLVYSGRQDKLGNGYMRNGQLVNEPLDFSKKNKWTLAHIHQLVQWIMFPESQPAKSRLRLTHEDYDFLRKHMSMMPQESRYPRYDRKDYWPTYVKFLLYGSEKEVVPPPGIRIFNKVGDAYGFLLDGAYVADFDKGIEFLLSAVIYCNEDGVLNDDNYDYDRVGFPFLKHLGQIVYQFESQRKKKHQPNLEAFKFDYNRYE